MLYSCVKYNNKITYNEVEGATSFLLVLLLAEATPSVVSIEGLGSCDGEK